MCDCRKHRFAVKIIAVNGVLPRTGFAANRICRERDLPRTGFAANPFPASINEKGDLAPNFSNESLRLFFVDAFGCILQASEHDFLIANGQP